MVKGEVDTSGNKNDVNNSSHPCCRCHCRHRRRRLIFIGLGISISYQFGWAAHQLSVFVTTTTGDVHIESDPVISNRAAADTKNIHHRTSSSSSSSPAPMKQSSYKNSLLPSHPFPNAELQALVNNNHPSSSTNNYNQTASAAAAYSCPNGLIYVSDQIALPDDDEGQYYSNNSSTSYSNNTHRRQRPLIPKILHFTAKSRCMTHAFASNIQVWKDRLGQQYSIFIHDDEAVNKFIYQKVWNEFPELKEVMACVTAGVRVY